MYTKDKRAPKNLFQALFVVLFPVFLMTSCLSADQEVTTDNTCCISSVGFTTLRRVEKCKAADGVTDSSYHANFSASRWIFTIDHKSLLVENRDSLPYNTDLSRVLMNLTYRGAAAYYRASDAWEDDPWQPYSSTDSIDIRRPLHIRIVASDKTERKYTLRMNLHTAHSDSLRWVSLESHEAISGANPMKAAAWQDKVAVMVNDGGAVAWVSHPKSDLGAWERFVTNLPANVDVNSLFQSDEALYVSAADGALYTSADGVAWTMLCQQEGLRLVGVSDKKVYAMFGGAINSTAEGVAEWSAESLDEDASLLPDAGMTSLTYEQNTTLTRIIFLGNRSVEADTTAVVWSKSWAEFENENSEGWMHYNRSADNSRQLPRFSQMSLMHYDNMLMLAPGKSLDGEVETLERFYVSSDNGLTWTRLQTILPPRDVRGIDGYVTSVVDDSKFIWLIAGGKVYRGRLNRLGYARPDIY